MSSIRRIIQEIHRRSLWQVLLIYVGGAWFCYEIIDTITDRLALPIWLPVLAIILFLIGLPFVLATAFVREVPPVEAAGAKSREPGAEAPAMVQAEADAERPRGEGRSVTRGLRKVVVALVTALAVWGVVATGWIVVGGKPARGTAGPAGERTMLVVLPFENLGASEDAYFADGITEEITSRLAEISGLGVIGRTSANRYRRTEATIAEIGEELGVDYVLEGTVRWEKPAQGGSRLRVTPQLIRVSDATHLWTNRYDAELASVFSIQSDVAQQVVQALQLTLLDPERRALEVKPTENLEAYDHYLRGNTYFDRGFSLENLRLAAELYEAAVRLDPKFGMAYARLSETHSLIHWYFWDRREEQLSLAKQAVDAALEIDPQLPQAHRALAAYHYYGERDYDRARTHLNIAGAGGRGDSELLILSADIHRRQGHWELALEQLMEAKELDPLSSLVALEIGVTSFFMRRYAEADRSFERTIALAPDQALPYIFKARNLLSWRGGTEESRAVLDRANLTARPDEWLLPSISGSWSLFRILSEDPVSARAQLEAVRAELDPGLYQLVIAELESRMGRADPARAHYDSARAVLEPIVREHPDEALFRAQLAVAYAGLGQADQALRAARTAVETLPLSRDALDGTDVGGYLAQVYLMVGETDSAIEQLEMLLEVPGWLSIRWLRLDPVWNPLRDHPRYRQLLQSED